MNSKSKKHYRPEMNMGLHIKYAQLHKVVKINIPSGTQSGKVFRLRGKGLPGLNTYQRGDLLVEVRVWTPTKLSTREKELLEQLSQSDNFQPPKKKGFFDKVKEALNI